MLSHISVRKHKNYLRVAFKKYVTARPAKWLIGTPTRPTITVTQFTALYVGYHPKVCTFKGKATLTRAPFIVLRSMAVKLLVK